jgi:predicted TIM-barrel fold metal-dependent hydrolase
MHSVEERELSMGVEYFDAFVVIGPRPHKHPAHPWRLDVIQKEMKSCSIAGALVSHTLSKHYDPMWGNRLLLDEIKDDSRMFPVWNIIPHDNDEFPTPGELYPLLVENKVPAVSIYPKLNAWDPLCKKNRDIFKLLERKKILTILTKDQLDSFHQLDQLLQMYPRLPLLLSHAHWSDQRFLVPLLQNYPNLHLTFTYYQIHHGLEYYVEKGFENQLVFASNAPQMAMGAHRTYIDYAQLSEETKAKIASGNLIRLLHGVQPEPAEPTPNDDPIVKAVKAGQPITSEVIDMHSHVLDDGLQGAGGGYVMHKGDMAGIMELHKRLGVDGAGIMSWIVNADAVGGNATVAGILEKMGSNYWGLASFDPSHYTQDELKEQLEYVFSNTRFIGIKPYPVFGLRYDNPLYDPVWQHGNQYQLYALIHRTTSDFSELMNLAPKYPQITWVVAHCGESYEIADQAIACMKEHANVMAELTYTPVTFGIIEYYVDQIGDDRIVYGSDAPMRDPRQQLGWVVFSHLPMESKERILGKNARAILQRSGRPVFKGRADDE